MNFRVWHGWTLVACAAAMSGCFSIIFGAGTVACQSNGACLEALGPNAQCVDGECVAGGTASSGSSGGGNSSSAASNASSSSSSGGVSVMGCGDGTVCENDTDCGLTGLLVCRQVLDRKCCLPGMVTSSGSSGASSSVGASSSSAPTSMGSSATGSSGASGASSQGASTASGTSSSSSGGNSSSAPAGCLLWVPGASTNPCVNAQPVFTAVVGRASNTPGFSSNLVVGSRNAVSEYAFSVAYAHPSNGQEVFHGFMVRPGDTAAPAAVSDTATAQTRSFNPMRQGLVRHSSTFAGSSLHMIFPVANTPTPVRFDVDSNEDLLLSEALMQAFNSTENLAVEHLELHPLDLVGNTLQVFALARETAGGAYKVAFRDYAYLSSRPRYLPVSVTGAAPGAPVRTAALVAAATAFGVVTVAETPPRMLIARRVMAAAMANTHPAEVQSIPVTGAFATDMAPLKSNEPVDTPARPLAVTYVDSRLLVAVPRQYPQGNSVVVYAVHPDMGDSVEVAQVPIGTGNQVDVRLSFQNFTATSTALLVTYRTDATPGQAGVARMVRIAKGPGGFLRSQPLDLHTTPDFTSSAVAAVGPYAFSAQSGVAFCSVTTQLDFSSNPTSADAFKCHSFVEVP